MLPMAHQSVSTDGSMRSEAVLNPRGLCRNTQLLLDRQRLRHRSQPATGSIPWLPEEPPVETNSDRLKWVIIDPAISSIQISPCGPKKMI